MEKEHNEKKHPSIFEPFALILNIITGIIGAIIGMQIVTTLGVTPNTAIIGALVAMLIARIPVAILKKYKSVHRQNLVQTSISSATFGAANSLLIPIGIPFAMGNKELVVPMLIGAALAMFVDAALLYKLFDSKLFPARETWAPGVATAESILAGDKGGKRAGLLGVGTVIGIIGSYFHISMSAFGVAFIGNIWALAMFGIGLMLRQYSVPWFNADVNALYIAHGVMIGAGIVALIQACVLIFSKQKKGADVAADKPAVDDSSLTRPIKEARRALGLGFAAYLIIALLIAIIGGIVTKMSLGMFLGFIIFAAFAAFVHELIVGIAAMHSGWFPAFAVAFITLLFGMMIGFPPVALALLAGFSAATGPAFADMGYDLKTGYILRGNGEDREFELKGRKQQYITGMIAFGVALLTVIVTYKGYFAQNLVPPIDKVYVSTIKAGASPEIALQLLLWAIPGAIFQLIGGPKRQIGVLFATGLLISTPNACWAVLVGILIRIIVLKVKKGEAESSMSILAAGFIAGDALFSFFNSVFKMRK
ncbi:OPT/YSL family transporter [Paenibacillus aceris]|uniref:Oligopeptide transporter (OPT) family protein n=1 Tax=Paenibacillus aceris TaxID=869555 RepID=A0ABS4I2F5_9BACL|nr:OPT/YSL family transporter [Paenibacillus aceris]MBP1964344.1 putative oligopeptide transporter (OPT) family protein [Paenibacillus aceris]NHW36663.1 OPT family oligopeptide transporter [Paenibacillus aceris]